MHLERVALAVQVDVKVISDGETAHKTARYQQTRTTRHLWYKVKAFGTRSQKSNALVGKAKEWELIRHRVAPRPGGVLRDCNIT